MKTFRQTQTAYISDDGRQYIAPARSTRTDEEGCDNYEIRWNVTIDNPDECDDESNMCKWDKYSIYDMSTGLSVDNAVLVDNWYL